MDNRSNVVKVIIETTLTECNCNNGVSNQNEDFEKGIDKEFIKNLNYGFQKEARKQVSIYLDSDVHKAFLYYGNIKGKGSQSELVNQLLKKTLLKDRSSHD